MRLRFNGHNYSVGQQETVLDCLIRHGIDIPNSCRSGVCQSCMLRAVEGKPCKASQNGLRPSRVEQNYFLSCSCVPEQDLEVVLPDTANLSVLTTVLGVDRLTPTTVRVRLRVPENYQYHAGQYLRVFHPDGDVRNYSIASLPDVDEFIELHVRQVPGGKVSNWLAQTLHSGDSIAIGEAVGDCYYLADKPNQPLLLIGTGTGLAPLYGILRDAILQQHRGEIHLYHGSHQADGLYLERELHDISSQYNVKYVPSISGAGMEENHRPGRCNDLALIDHPDLKDWRIFICGNPDMVRMTQRKVFLAGASMADILIDSFLPST